MAPGVLEIPCAVCGGVSMRIATTLPGDPLDMPHKRPPGDPGLAADADGVLTAIDGTTSWLAASALRGGLGALTSALEAGDVAALLALDPEIVPLWCAPCGVAYCRAHWTLWDEFDPDDPAWFDEMRGRCPRDHERRVYD